MQLAQHQNLAGFFLVHGSGMRIACQVCVSCIIPAHGRMMPWAQSSIGLGFSFCRSVFRDVNEKWVALKLPVAFYPVSSISLKPPFSSPASQSLQPWCSVALHTIWS
jgi:hypothetical protein